MKKYDRGALTCAALGNGIFGLSFMFSRIALGIAQPFVMLMYRFDITFIVLAVIAAFASRRLKTSDKGIDWLRFDLRGKNILPLIGLGVIQPVGYFLCESYGISMTNATFSGVIIALVPLVGMGLGVVMLGEKPKGRQIACSVLSIAGVVLMTVQQNAEGQILPMGVVLLFGAVLTGSLFHIVSRRASATFSVLERTVVMMGTAAAAFTLLALFQTHGNGAQLLEPLRHGEFLTAMIYLALCSSVMAFMALNYANNFLPVTVATAFANLTTVISVFAGVIFLHEPFGVVSLVASLMIIIGVWGVQKA